ncbi:MAG: lipoate--protein ligase family protein [Campylobacterota bacterium]|nr:lipoate--protein ligase family protein [Campylobacterota bacterium]
MFATLANQSVRLITSCTLGAKENMAIDEALFASFDDVNDDLPILRLYTWQNCFTIGISQDFNNYKELQQQTPNFSKRITGGGVLFHGEDISYSLVLPSSLMKNLSVKQSYEKICSFLLSFYNSLGMDVCYAKEIQSIPLSKSEYCQVGFEPYDIIYKGKKLGGNAQRRTKKVLFQHGSIPLNELNMPLEDIQKKLCQAFEKTFDTDLKQSELNQKELDKMNTILKEKYDHEK